MVYRLARAVDRASAGSWGDAVPPVAALVAALYGYFILYAATLMTETFYIVALLWSLERALALDRQLRTSVARPRVWRHALLLGLSLGLATLLRQSILPWAAVLFAYLLIVGLSARQVRATVLTLGAAGLIVVALILPWTVRNYLVYGEFLLLNSNAGYAMYSAQHPMHGTRFREFDAAPMPEGFWGRSEAELDGELMRLGIGFVLDEPGRYLLLSLSRVRAFFEFWPTPDTTLLHNVGRTGSYGLLLPFLLYGLFLALRQPGFAVENALLFLYAGFYALLHILTWAMVRYRLPVDAALMPLAAWALVRLARKARSMVAQSGRWAAVRERWH